MSTVDKDFSLILPPPIRGINDESAVSELYGQLAVYSVTSLSGVDEDGTPDPRILVGLREYVFDVSAINGFFAPNKLYSKFAGRDISCALARSSYEDENINRGALGFDFEGVESVGWLGFPVQKSIQNCGQAFRAL
ncbi:hypothetical protein C8F04DRAFT_1080890, partial [Mycena alexandri]